MNFDFNDTERPLFIQIAEEIKDEIVRGGIKEGEQIPSSTEISLTYKINPATVNKGVNLLVDEGIIYKQRGIGMFVAEGAVKKLKKEGAAGYYEKFVQPMLREAEKLGISADEIIEFIEKYQKEDIAKKGGGII